MVITSDEARSLAAYINTIHALVNNNAKFFACLPSIILDHQSGRDVAALALEIVEHG